MADTVKVQAMRKLEEVLRAIPEIGSVHRWQGSPVDLDQVRLPALFIVEEEEARERRNRLAVGVLKMNLQVFIRLTPAGAASFNDVADNLQGKIHNALIHTALFKGLVENIQEGQFRKDYPNDLYGLLCQSFTLTYAHAWGDGQACAAAAGLRASRRAIATSCTPAS